MSYNKNKFIHLKKGFKIKIDWSVIGTFIQPAFVIH